MASSITAGERSALLTRHAVSLAKFDAVRQHSLGIKKILHPLQATTLATYLKDGRAIRWDQNRKEVKARAGDATKFMLTMATRRSGGMFVCYWNGAVATGADGKPEIHPTQQNPIVIYEGGHRSRWLESIFDNTTEVYEGLDMAMLEQLRPEAVREMRASRITLDVNTHESGIVPIEYIKEEYEIINTTTATFSAGEIVASSTDDVRNDLQALVRKALSHRKPSPKARDGEKAEWRALANGALGQIMLMKVDALVGQPAPSAEATLRAREIIECFAEAERQVIALFANKALLKKRMDARKSDFKMDAALMFAFNDCVSVAGREAVIADYVSLYRNFFEDKAVWSATIKEITGGGAGKHNEGNKIFEARWKKVVNLLRPAAQ
jgi:hypothetical protein